MSENEACPYHNEDCAFSDLQELALTGKIMEEIGRFGGEEQAAPCPHCLRDTMLTVAALLHLEGLKLSGANIAQIRGKAAKKQFVLAAGERLEAVIEAEAARRSASKH